MRNYLNKFLFKNKLALFSKKFLKKCKHIANTFSKNAIDFIKVDEIINSITADVYF